MFLSRLLIFISLLFFGVQAGDLQNAIDLYKARQFEQAKDVFESIIDEDEKNAEAMHWLSRTWLSLNDADEAVDFSEQAVELAPNNADYHYWLGQALGMQVQEASIFSKAFIAGNILEAFEKAIELDPKHLGARLGAAQFYLRAPGIMGGDVAKAKEQATILMEMGSRRGELLMIQILEQEGETVEAEKAYQKFDETFDTSADSYGFYNTYGYFLLGQKKYDLAIEKFKRQVALAPDRANPYDSLGDAYKAAGRLHEALAAYEKAVELDPDFEPSVENRDELRDQLNR